MNKQQHTGHPEGRSRCDSVQSSLTDYLEGQLSPALRGPLRAHLQRCPACRQELHRELRLRELLAGLERPAAPAGFADAVLAAVFAQVPLREQVAPAPERGVSMREWALLPVALLLLALAMGQWLRTPGSEGLRDSATEVIVEGGRELTGALTLIESARDTGDLLTRPARDKAASLLRVERTLRSVIPPELGTLILLVAFGPIVLVLVVYRIRLRGVLSHVLSYQILR